MLRLRIKKLVSGLESSVPLLLLLLTLITSVAGCSRSSRHRLLTLVFDDVPPLEDRTKTTGSDSLAQTALVGPLQPDSTIAKIPTWTFHPRLERRECATCHDREQSFRLIEEPQTLCLTCHEQAEGEVVHAPAEAGECVECHNPHGTQTAYLLTAEGQELCLPCHDQADVKSAAHEGAEDIVCYECHDPHNAGNKYLIK